MEISSFVKKLFVKIPEKYKEEFERETSLHNTKNCMQFSKVVFLFEVIIIAVSFMPMPKTFYGTTLEYYRIMYILLGVIILLYMFLFKTIRNGKIKKQITIQYIHLSYVVIGLLWGSGISILDQIYYHQIIVYLTFIVGISLVIFIKPYLLLYVYTVIQVLFMSMIYLMEDSKLQIFGHCLNTTIFITIGWFVSRHLYKDRLESFIKRKIIEEKNVELNKANKKLEELSSHDSLTGLYNRRKLNTILDEQWENSINKNIKLFMIMIDIDYFKKFNDTYGHIEGDRCIIEISNILKSFCRENGGFAARYGGDEFCLIFPGIQKNILESKIISLREKVRGLKLYNQLSPIDKYITISLGLYVGMAEKNIDPWSFVINADRDLYNNKLRRKFKCQ
ncbi:GGDEF domain-containing protein [Clostridium sediminicola]|uniref:GGDEF domain-containing protein n=1 Tax=Clostridium sediminicola TaxID=3114879 RepID=UPI0031F21653